MPDPTKWMQPRTPVWVKEEDIPRLPKRIYVRVIVPFLNQLKARPMEWAIYSYSRKLAMTRKDLPHTEAMFVEIKNRPFFDCPTCKEAKPWHPRGCPTCGHKVPRSESTWRVFMRWTGEYVPFEEEELW